MTAANWGSGNYLIVKENYIAEQIARYVSIDMYVLCCISLVLCPEICILGVRETIKDYFYS